MKKQERLSLLMDGESIEGHGTHDTLGDQLLGDHHLQQQWQGYHLIRDTLQGSLYADLPVNFAARVMQAVQSEQRQETPVVPSTLAAYWAAGRHCWAALVASMNPLGEFGLAAGVALLLLYGAHCYQGASTPGNFHDPLLRPLPLGGETLPVGYALSGSQQQAQVLRLQLLNDKKRDYATLRLQQSRIPQAIQEPSRVDP